MPVDSWGQEAPRVLMLTKSSGWEHDCIKVHDGKPGHAQSVVQKLADANGANLTTTKDASLINEKDLQGYDMVIFYTSGDLTKKGTDGKPPMGEHGLAALQSWIKDGGAFMGFHCASDTFGHHKPDPKLPYINMLGAEFEHHGDQFKGTVRIVDSDHPAATPALDGLYIREEWYLFKNMNKEDIHVLALLDPGDEGEKQEEYDIASYPIIWCREYGEGRIYFNAMGHREDVWDNEIFQTSFIDAATWAIGETHGNSDPNYKDVVPAAKD